MVRVAIEVAELFADGKVTNAKRQKAETAAAAAYADAAYAAYAAAAAACNVERINQSRLLSLAVALPEWSPQWHTSTTCGLAAAIYQERAWDRIPILADALEEAGCDHPWLLTAMRDERFIDQLRGVE